MEIIPHGKINEMMQYQTKETMDKTQDWTKDQAKQDTKRPRQAKQE